jgi:WD40 repeat protein
LALACVVSAACDSPPPTRPDHGGGKLDDPIGLEPSVVWSIGGNGGGDAAWSPDGTRIATAGPTIQILEPVRGHVLATFDDQKIKRGIAWSPDGSQLATGEEAGEVALRSTAEGVIAKVLDADMAVFSVAWSADGSRIAAGGQNKLRVWNAGTGAVVNTISTFGAVRRLEFTPDGGRLIVSLGTVSGTVEVIGVADAVRLFSTDSDCAALGGDCGAYNPTFDVFAVATSHSLEIFDAVSGTQVRTIGASPEPIRAIEWIDDTHLRMLGDSALRKFDFETEKVTSLTLRTGRYTDFEQHPSDGSVLLYGARETSRQVVDVLSGTTIRPLNHHGRIVDGIGFDHTGELIASLTVDPHDPVQIRTADGAFALGMRDEFFNGNPLSLAWRPPGEDVTRTLATAGVNATQLFFFNGTQIYRDEYLNQDSDLAAIAWSHDGERLATVGDKIRIWSASGTLHSTFGTLFAKYREVTWSDGDLLAVATVSGKIEIWSATSKTKVREIAAANVFEMAWRGDLLATLPIDSSELRVWNAATGELFHESEGLDISPHAIVWHPDGERLALAGNSGAVAIWDAASAEIVDQFTAHAAFVEAIDWHPDGDRVITAGGSDGRITLWSVAPTE